MVLKYRVWNGIFTLRTVLMFESRQNVDQIHFTYVLQTLLKIIAGGHTKMYQLWNVIPHLNVYTSESDNAIAIFVRMSILFVYRHEKSKQKWQIIRVYKRITQFHVKRHRTMSLYIQCQTGINQLALILYTSVHFIANAPLSSSLHLSIFPCPILPSEEKQWICVKGMRFIVESMSRNLIPKRIKSK